MNSFTVALLQDVITFSIFAIVGIVLASRRDRNKVLWGFLGVFIIPIFILLFLPKLESKSTND